MASGSENDICNEATAQSVVSTQAGSLLNVVVLGNQQASDIVPATSLAAVNVGAVNAETVANHHPVVMALQPGQTHSALQLSQAQLLQHHQAGGASVKSPQHTVAALQQQQHEQARLHQQQTHRAQMPIGATIQQPVHGTATTILTSSQIQVPIIGTQAGGNVVSSTHEVQQQQPVRNIHPKQKVQGHIQNAQRMVTPVGKQQFNVSQQQLLRQYKQGQMQQVNPRMQTHQQQFASNKASVMHQAQLQQGMVQQGLGTGMGINNLTNQKSGMQSPPRTPTNQGHSAPNLPHSQMQHSQTPHPQVQHPQPPHQKAQHPLAQHQPAQHSPTTSHEPAGPGKGSGDNLAGQTITVEAVECTPIPGQTRRLIKLVVSGAKGQAHSILSKNQQLQQQILNMMQKALTSTAEVSFPSDPEQPIRVTCKPNTDTNVSASGDSTRKPPLIPMSAGSPDSSTPQQLANRNNTNACGTPVSRVTSPRSHMAGIGMMPRQVNMQNQPTMSTPMTQQTHSPHNSMPARFLKPAKRMTTPEQYVRNILQSEAHAVNAMKANEKKPVGVATQYPQNMTMLHQQLSQGARPQVVTGIQQQQRQHHLEEQQDEAGGSVVTATNMLSSVQATKESGSIKVISPAKTGIDNPQKFVTGNDYAIECPNGKRIVGIWDGKYFKVKNPVSDNQGQQAGKVPKYMCPPKSSKSLNPKSSAKVPIVAVGEMGGLPILSMGGPKLKPKPQISVASTDEQDLGIITVARPESQQILPAPSIIGEASDASMPSPVQTEHVRKRPPIPKQEGKYAVCDNCGNLSSDYETCESCKRPLPDDPKLFAPNASGTQLILLPNNSSMGPQQFYANKLVHQTVLQKASPGAVVQGRGRGRGVGGRGRGKSPRGRGRGRGGHMSHEPDTVTILSSDEDGEETRAPAYKFPRLDKGVLMGKKFKMEDETGKVVLKPNVKKQATLKSPNISATKVTEQKSGGNTVIRMVDPVIQLSAQAVRIGSMQSIPVNSHVEFSLKGFRMMLKLPTESGVGKMVDVRVEAREIIDILTCFSKFLVLFIRVSPPCALRIRNRCGMEINSEHYFDPNSKLDCHKHLTVLMSQWNQRDQEIFKAVCRKMEADKMCGQAKILSNLAAEKANDMLVQASYVGPQIKKKPATTVTGGQVVSQVTTAGVVTSGGLVASQVLINQGGIISQVLHMPGQALPAGHVILSLPAAQVQKAKTSSVDGDDEEEPIDRSRSPSPLLPSFAGPVVRLFTYPPPPITGGIPVTNEDLFCLNEGEFLNDVIIDFYLKYLINEVLTDEDKDRTHVFSSFFYRRLTQKQNKRHIADDQQSMTAQEKRHSRVKTWTRHVDLFDKDFVIVPINESAHWYLAIICFPGLHSPIIEEEPETPPPSQLELSSASLEKEGEDSKQSTEENSKQTDSAENSEQSTVTEQSTQDQPRPEQSRPKAGGSQQKPKIRRTVLQPTILIFDSLSGPGRTGVVRTLREYIQVEWNIKKAEQEGARVFTKDNMRGCITKCPQQTNFSDCGVFVLQYVESFFKTPIRDYSVHPMDLNNWFPESCVKQKREELRLLILDLQQELNAELDYDPTQDGCIGTSPSHMVTIPLSMEGSQIQTPVIMTVAGGVNVVQQSVATPLMALPNVPLQDESEPEPPGSTDNEAQPQEQFSDAPESNDCASQNTEGLHGSGSFVAEDTLPEQENTVSEGSQNAYSQEDGLLEYDDEQGGVAHTKDNGEMQESMLLEQMECDQTTENAQHMSSELTVPQDDALQCEHYTESEQYLEHDHAVDYEGNMESVVGHEETTFNTEQSVNEESQLGHSEEQDGV